MHRGIIYRFLSNKFEALGRTVTRSVSWFIVVPLFVSLLLATGLQRLEIKASIEKFYAPYGSSALRTRSYLQSSFPLSSSPEFYPSRSVAGTRYASIIIKAKDGQSVLRKWLFEELSNLNRIIRNNVNITTEDRVLHYGDICAKRRKRCYENNILSLREKFEDVGDNGFPLRYPLDKSFGSRDFETLALGGVTVGENGTITSARAVRLMYFLDSGSRKKEALCKEWESKFLSQVARIRLKNITVDRYASVSLEEPVPLIFEKAKLCTPYTFILVIAFTVSTCLTPDCLRSKPWTGIMSAIGTGMSLASGFGLLTYIGYRVDILALIVPFLVLGIGMDDTFVMLSAWKRTSPKKSVEERMAETYSETGISITITSVTNIVSFGFGAIFGYFESAQHFCVYMAICLVFDFIYQITFVGATLAVCGMAEEKRLHSFTFIPLEKTTSKGRTSCFYSTLCCPIEEESREGERRRCKFLLDFWENLASLLTKKSSKAIVLVVFGVYLSTALWSFTKLSFRCHFSPSVLYDTYQHSYKISQEEDYYQYQHGVQFVINRTLNYADPKVQRRVLDMIDSFESDPLFSGPLLTQSWLKAFKTFLNDRRISYFTSAFDMSDKDTFYYLLRRVFFRQPLARHFEKDVVFNENRTEIISSRFILQTNITRDESDFYYRLRDFKKVLEKEEYPISIYNQFLFFFDGLDVIFVMMVQTICVIAVLVTLASAILLPNFICILCVGFSIVSVVTGVVGYMFLLDVALEIISVVVLIVTCGFSVDYAAHVSCAYVSCKDKDPNQRLRKAIIMTGMPIFQGSVSTICVVVFFFNPPSHEFEVTVKIITLVSIIAALHGIFVIPVVMCLLDSASSKWRDFRKASKPNKLDIASAKSSLSFNGLAYDGVYKVSS